MKLIAVALWLLTGTALTSGVYWTFLITPESTIWMLAISALLLLIAFFLVGITISGAIVGWRHGISASHLRTAIAGAPAMMPAALIIALVWWLVSGVTDRVTINGGPINAWFIAAFGWDDVSWLFTGISWLAVWLKWVVAPMLAVSVMAGVIAAGWRALAGIGWVTRALAPLPIVLATLTFAVLVAAPWLYVAPWRPAAVPANVVELMFIIAKLSVTALLMAVGVALIIRLATWTTSTPSSAS